MANRIQRIKNFIADIKDDGGYPMGVQVRLSPSHEIIKTNVARQIRSKKHDADGIAFDELGNATVLHADGTIKQYVSQAELRAVGIR